VVGEGAVGKTSIVTRYIDDAFYHDTKITVGTNLFITRVKFPEKNIDLTLQIWDIGGRQKFENIRPVFYSGTKGVVYTYDLTRPNTLKNLLKWKEEINSYIGPKPSILVGNKYDLIQDGKERPIKPHDLGKIKRRLDVSNHLDTSAKNDRNIDLIFLNISMLIYRYYNPLENNYNSISH